MIPKRFDFSFDTKRTFLFSYDTGSKLTCDSIFFSRVVFLVDSSRSKVIVLYDRQCKIKRCPQNGLTAYTIVIYVWPSERFCGQSVHGNFRGIQCLLPVVFNVIEGWKYFCYGRRLSARSRDTLLH